MSIPVIARLTALAALAVWLAAYPHLARAQSGAQQVAERGTSDDGVERGARARCRRVRATAESQAFLLVSPVLWAEGVHVPRVGDESGAGLVQGGDYQLRAALSWSPIDLARGVLLLEQSGTECRQIEASTRVMRTLELGDDVGELVAHRAEREALIAGRERMDAIVAHEEARLAAGVGTEEQLSAARREVLRLERRVAQIDARIELLLEAGHERLDPARLDEDVALYEASAEALEAQRSSTRRLSPWTVLVRGGVVPAERLDWFGQVQVGLNLGVIAHHVAEDAVVEARRDELRDEASELRGRVARFEQRMRASLRPLREELAHVERMIALSARQRDLLAQVQTSEAEHTRALLELELLGLDSQRAHVAALIAERVRLADETGVDIGGVGTEGEHADD